MEKEDGDIVTIFYKLPLLLHIDANKAALYVLYSQLRQIKDKKKFFIRYIQLNTNYGFFAASFFSPRCDIILFSISMNILQSI